MSFISFGSASHRRFFLFSSHLSGRLIGHLPLTIGPANSCISSSHQKPSSLALTTGFFSFSFQLSPDFRPRASSNTSSCGRLSPIPAVIGMEPDWSSPGPFTNSNYSPEMGGNYSPDQLAGNLEERMKLQTDYIG